VIATISRLTAAIFTWMLTVSGKSINIEWIDELENVEFHCICILYSCVLTCQFVYP
jgi:hypothetical protein